MAATDDEFFASLERNFIGIGCTMEAQTTVSNSTQCGLLIGVYKKYTVSGVTFFFKELYDTVKEEPEKPTSGNSFRRTYSGL